MAGKRNEQRFTMYSSIVICILILETTTKSLETVSLDTSGDPVQKQNKKCCKIKDDVPGFVKKTNGFSKTTPDDQIINKTSVLSKLAKQDIDQTTSNDSGFNLTKVRSKLAKENQTTSNDPGSNLIKVRSTSAKKIAIGLKDESINSGMTEEEMDLKTMEMLILTHFNKHPAFTTGYENISVRSCFGRCGIHVKDTIPFCSCDLPCSIHNVCCEDVSTVCPDIIKEASEKLNESLFETGAVCEEDVGIFVVSLCPVGNVTTSGSAFENSSTTVTDIMRNQVFVTGSTTGIVYKNLSVYQCHNRHRSKHTTNPERPLFWTVVFDTPVKIEFKDFRHFWAILQTVDRYYDAPSAAPYNYQQCHVKLEYKKFKFGTTVQLNNDNTITAIRASNNGIPGWSQLRCLAENEDSCKATRCISFGMLQAVLVGNTCSYTTTLSLGLMIPVQEKLGKKELDEFHNVEACARREDWFDGNVARKLTDFIICASMRQKGILKAEREYDLKYMNFDDQMQSVVSTENCFYETKIFMTHEAMQIDELKEYLVKALAQYLHTAKAAQRTQYLNVKNRNMMENDINIVKNDSRITENNSKIMENDNKSTENDRKIKENFSKIMENVSSRQNETVPHGSFCTTEIWKSSCVLYSVSVNGFPNPRHWRPLALQKEDFSSCFSQDNAGRLFKSVPIPVLVSVVAVFALVAY